MWRRPGSDVPQDVISPEAGAPASTVTVSGYRFGANEAVDIYFDTTDEALAAANANGTFRGAVIRVPAWAVPGTPWVTAVGRHSGLAAQAAFTVQANWPQFRDTPAHRGFNTSENVKPLCLRFAWRDGG
jgi:hypothetical protein